jgi:hypothetical protein
MTEAQQPYELWIARREMWMPVLMAIGFEYIGDVPPAKSKTWATTSRCKPVGSSAASSHFQFL